MFILAKRVDLQSLLETILGTNKVYFQPPANVLMQYPCIRYTYSRKRTIFADNSPYRHKQSYQVTLITKDPDSTIPDKISELSLCMFDRFFVADNLNHFVFTLYY